MPSDYSTPGGGALKLKDAKDAGIDKKRKKKKPLPSSSTPEPSKPVPLEPSSITKALAEEEADMRNNSDGAEGPAQSAEHDAGSERPNEEKGEQNGVQKTAAEIRYEEMRRKRLDERLKREGIKTHKERVEELNRYLSNLSEHHDMPRIGPG